MNIQDFPIKTTLPVQWGEMDAFGHVNNVTYFRYLETGRLDLINSIDLYRENWVQEIGTILLKIDCRYLKPLIFPDTVHIYTRISKIGNTSITMEQLIVSNKLGEVATSESVIVTFDYRTQQKVPVPENVKTAIKQLKNRQRT